MSLTEKMAYPIIDPVSDLQATRILFEVLFQNYFIIEVELWPSKASLSTSIKAGKILGWSFFVFFTISTLMLFYISMSKREKNF